MFDGEQPFTYNKKDKTLNVEMQDADLVEIFGTDVITLTFTRK